MTQIDFHTNVPDSVAHVCRLVRKASAQEDPVQMVILAKDKKQMLAIDQALWIFPEHDFLPHAMLDEEAAEFSPIVLAESGQTDLPHHDILINLTEDVPQEFAQFARLFEVISLDDAGIQAGRQRYHHYRQRGYALQHHTIGKS